MTMTDAEDDLMQRRHDFGHHDTTLDENCWVCQREIEKIMMELDELTVAHAAALAEYEHLETDAVYQAEQEAWDALIDFVEANGLNGTEHDPRP